MISVLRTDGEWDVFSEAAEAFTASGVILSLRTSDGKVLAEYRMEYVKFWIYGDARETKRTGPGGVST